MVGSIYWGLEEQEGIEIDSLVRIQFYSEVVDSDGDMHHVWHDSVRCNELYKDNLTDPTMMQEIGGNGYICPDIKNFTLNNSPWNL